MAEDIKLNTSIQPDDIVFDCPQCGKNLAIEARGAGMTITCPDCQNPIQVPYPESESLESGETISDEQVQLLREQLAAAQGRASELAGELETAQAKIERLEKTQSELQAHLEQISTEWGVIQNALDRVMGLMQDLRMR